MTREQALTTSTIAVRRGYTDIRLRHEAASPAIENSNYYTYAISATSQFGIRMLARSIDPQNMPAWTNAVDAASAIA